MGILRHVLEVQMILIVYNTSYLSMFNEVVVGTVGLPTSSSNPVIKSMSIDQPKSFNFLLLIYYLWSLYGLSSIYSIHLS